MPRYDRTQRIVPWIIVVVFLTGGVLVALSIIDGSLILGIVGSVAVVGSGLSGYLLPRFGLSAPMSYNEDYPGSTGSGIPEIRQDEIPNEDRGTRE